MTKLQMIRDDFPITTQKFISPEGDTREVIYLDHGASTHPPGTVLRHYSTFLEHYYANIHRGRHYLSQKASDLFDEVIEIVQNFVGADSAKDEVIFTQNTTSAIDIAAHILSGHEGATIVTELEHHSNDLPHRRRGEVLKAHVTPEGRLDYDEIERLLQQNRVKLVAVTGASNVTGYLPDIHRIARMAHKHGAYILVDGAQLLAHRRVRMRPDEGLREDSNIDFFAAAGHKAYAPFGSAFLVARQDVCDAAPPYMPGGGTVAMVTNDDVAYLDGYERHAGGTPNIPGVIALGKSLHWLSEIGLDWIEDHEKELTSILLDGIRSIGAFSLLGDIGAEERLGVASIDPRPIHDAVLATVLNNRYGIATRNGCFCAHPYMIRLLGIEDPVNYIAAFRRGEFEKPPGAVRATVGVYNNRNDVERFLEALDEIARNPNSISGVDQSDEMRCIDFA